MRQLNEKISLFYKNKGGTEGQLAALNFAMMALKVYQFYKSKDSMGNQLAAFEFLPHAVNHFADAIIPQKWPMLILVLNFILVARDFQVPQGQTNAGKVLLKMANLAMFYRTFERKAEIFRNSFGLNNNY